MAWLKTISLDGTSSRRELPSALLLELETRRRKPNPAGFPQPKSSPFIHCAHGVWFGDETTAVMSGSIADDAPPRDSIRLEHGSVIRAGARAYVYVDRAEHRDGALEAAACASPAGLEPWLAWLEAQGDPYAEPLRRMMNGHVYGPSRERWWLEGIDRGLASIGAAFVMRDGFLREADLLHGKLEIDLLIAHLLGLRVARGLERLQIAMSTFVHPSSWRAFGEAAYWKQIRWPGSFRTLHLDCVGANRREARAFTDALAQAMPQIEVTCSS